MAQHLMNKNTSEPVQIGPALVADDGTSVCVLVMDREQPNNLYYFQCFLWRTCIAQISLFGGTWISAVKATMTWVQAGMPHWCTSATSCDSLWICFLGHRYGVGELHMRFELLLQTILLDNKKQTATNYRGK